MSGALVIPRDLRERQQKASDPARSIWVSANAGSGKTHVLTQRVIRLLLSGVAPSKILCLTFTKAAAAQMASRVFDELARWTDLDDATLSEAIIETGAPAPCATDLVLARRLFTRTVETPGGLKIQTIHAFCERLLHLFPFEANVPARFAVADDTQAAELLARAQRAAITDARQTGLAGALALIADLAGAGNIDALLATTIRLRAKGLGRVDLQSTLPDRLAAGASASTAEVRRAMIEEGLAPALWPSLADWLDQGTANDRKQAVRLREAFAASVADGEARARSLGPYLTVFFDSNGGPRSSLATKKSVAARPDLAAALASEQERLIDLRERLRAGETVERTQALLALAAAVTDRYAAAKIAGGLLDFDDLIERTLVLLGRSASGWVLHKLDAGIDHILVDEAQDTSETQWRILEALTAEFTAGEGVRGEGGQPRARSFFVVGDDKQSIFSFQGAAPLMFDTMRATFERRFIAGRRPFERVSLKTSFRSVPGILAAVDTVFSLDAHQDGLVSKPDLWPAHESIKATLPSLVEIWPPLGATAAPEPADWTIPLDTPSELDPANVVADRVALKIRQLTAPDAGEWVHEGRGTARRAIRPGDILILVRTRNEMFEAVIRALKRYSVPVAGADRLDVANHIAVMDLVAAGRVALLPRDDLTLACVLKSPLFGFDDDDLIALAPGRAGALMDALGASCEPRHRDAHRKLEHWSQRASAVTPFAFYVELLGRDGGRRLMELRLGPEAHDAVDEFLRLALAHEGAGAPSLGGFLTDMEALNASIKRDMEGPGDAVRVMTVHAAKGLEAKIVFLPDTCAVPSANLEATLFDLNAGSELPPVLAWSPHKAEDPAPVAAARQQARQATMREYRRLLYVALTRAEERLYIAGFHKTTKPAAECWNTMIEHALAQVGIEDVPAHWDDTERIGRLVTPGLSQQGISPPIEREQRAQVPSPDWLFQPLSAPVTAPQPLRPSHATVSRAVANRERASGRRRGIAFGTALHLLLQYLPALPEEERGAAGRALLAQRRDQFPPAIHAAVLAQTLATMALPVLAPLFGPDARAEVAVIGTLARDDSTRLEVRGAIDRLVVTPHEVIVADFKSGRPDADDPRTSESAIPQAYLDQLALYRRVLAPLWPDRPLRMLLVWTAEPLAVEVPAGALTAAAARLLTAVAIPEVSDRQPPSQVDAR